MQTCDSLMWLCLCASGRLSTGTTWRLNKMVSEDIVYGVSGRGPVSGVYEGRLIFIESVQKIKEKRFIFLNPSYELHEHGGTERVKCE